MLNGIGGCTIEEAQRRLSYQEVQSWAKYRELRGSLHPGMRIERSTALLATLYANAHRGKGAPAKITDFMPHEKEPEISLEQAMKTWH
ncbi:phage tail assembly protein T [Microbulbifer sp. ZKSA002]|uniref:phage tail assembly protein T n=1 Tax=Microbulbifer sp. ZKSA002 TaxID=3243388 RepID=UPI00403A4C0E